MSQRVPRNVTDSTTSLNENDRQYHVIDLMLTAHSLLRDRYERRSSILKIGLFCASIMLSGFAFIDDRLFTVVGLTPDAGKIGIGVASLIVLALSVTEMLVKWDQRAAVHGEAAKRLALLKLKYRRAFTKHKGGNVRINEGLTRDWERVAEGLPPIPDGQFVRLKHSHHIKRQLSEEADRNRDVPYYLLALGFHTKGCWKVIRDGLARRPEPGASVELASPPRVPPEVRAADDSGSSERKEG
jgi:hypothetical protein